MLVTRKFVHAPDAPLHGGLDTYMYRHELHVANTCTCNLLPKMAVIYMYINYPTEGCAQQQVILS